MGNQLILCIEDRPPDIRLIKESLDRLNKNYLDNPIKMDIIKDGKEASDYLHQLSDKEQMPDIILLNLNLPGITGNELLIEIRKMSKFNQIPIIIHTNCTSMDFYPDLFVQGANAFLSKPHDFDKCIDAYIRTIDYWLNCHPNHHHGW